MITAHYINEGASLVLNAGDHPHYISVTDDTKDFCEAAYKESFPETRCEKCRSWIPREKEVRLCETCEHGNSSFEACEETIKSLRFKLKAADHGLEEQQSEIDALKKKTSEVVTALEDAIDLIEGCTITEVQYGYSKTLKRIKEVLATTEPIIA